MHLFLIDLYVSVDMLSPIINLLNKKYKILICSINPNQSFKNDRLLKNLINKNVVYNDFIPIRKHEIFLLLVINFAKLLPNFIQKKIKFFWVYIYRNTKFSSVSIIENFLKKNNILSITYDEAAPKKYIELFFVASQRLNIPMIKVDDGIGTINALPIKVRFRFSNHFITSSYLKKKNKIFNNHNIKYIGSLRYSKYWLKILDKIFLLENKKNLKQKIKIGFFTKYQSREYLNMINLIKKLKKNTSLEVKTREKPRDLYPLKFAYFYRDDYNSSQLIRWSDIIVSSRSTSVLAEAIMRNKKVFLLKYLYNEKKFSNLYKYSFIKIINRESDFIEKINKLKKQRKYFLEEKKCLKHILIDYGKEKKIKNDYIKFYSSFKKLKKII